MKSKKVITYLDKALEHINSVPYGVTLRWVFYRVWQEGLLQACWKKGFKTDFKTKKIIEVMENDAQYKLRCYRNFCMATATARKQLFGGWERDSLIDDTRNILWSGLGSFDREDWINDLSCYLDKFENQDNVLLIMFEAQAMISQFKYITKHIPLIPSSGDFSIHYKNSIANAIKELGERYGKPIIVLYFGDCDDKGRKIRESALRTIHDWCDIDFEDFYCGLTEEQAKGFNIPSNPEKPNQYQWEALSDDQAREIILSYVEKYQNMKKIKVIEKLEEDILEQAKKKLKGVRK